MGKVIEITEEQALELKGKEFAKDSHFNPIQDAKDKWVISEEEVIQYKQKDGDSDFSYIKTKPSKEHEPKIEKDPFKDEKI